MHAEEQDERAENAAIQPEARLASTTINPPRIAPTVGMKASSPAWMPRMNELGMPMIGKPDPGHEEHRRHGDDLRDQPAFQRIADAVDDNGGAWPMPCRHHEQQPVAVNAWLGGEGEPEEQHDEEIADAADGAEEQS